MIIKLWLDPRVHATFFRTGNAYANGFRVKGQYGLRSVARPFTNRSTSPDGKGGGGGGGGALPLINVGRSSPSLPISLPLLGPMDNFMA